MSYVKGAIDSDSIMQSVCNRPIYKGTVWFSFVWPSDLPIHLSNIPSIHPWICLLIHLLCHLPSHSYVQCICITSVYTWVTFPSFQGAMENKLSACPWGKLQLRTTCPGFILKVLARISFSVSRFSPTVPAKGSRLLISLRYHSVKSLKYAHL